jgi:hypothetical protein
MLRFVLGSGCFAIDPIDLNRQGITIRLPRTVFVACLKIAMSGGNAAAACNPPERRAPLERPGAEYHHASRLVTPPLAR